MVKDWFPSGVSPQSSKPPYVLDVIRPDGKSVKFQNNAEPYYEQELTYKSKLFFINKNT